MKKVKKGKRKRAAGESREKIASFLKPLVRFQLCARRNGDLSKPTAYPRRQLDLKLKPPFFFSSLTETYYFCSQREWVTAVNTRRSVGPRENRMKRWQKNKEEREQGEKEGPRARRQTKRRKDGKDEKERKKEGEDRKDLGMQQNT